jgi:glycosyltransferase involved in cell wall biosynthesis
LAAKLWRALESKKIDASESAQKIQLHSLPKVEIKQRLSYLKKLFENVFPQWPTQLSDEDIEFVMNSYLPPSCGISLFKSVMSHYDIIHAYGTEPIWPLLLDHRPFVAFEYGTIRKIPFYNSWLGRFTSLAFQQANHVIITNADNQRAARKLNLSNYCFIPHAVNERWHQSGIGDKLRKKLSQELKADFLVFHPPRQHWDDSRDPMFEKGNDIFIKGFARFVHELQPRAAAVFVDWGKNVAESKNLIIDLNLADRVKWIPVQPNCNMTRYMDASDVVADQFYLGAFGNITPKAMALGKPALCYVNEEQHRWCFSEMPPVMNARTPEEVFDVLSRAYTDHNWRAELGQSGKRWYERYHSNAVIREKLIALYEEVLESTVQRS